MAKGIGQRLPPDEQNFLLHDGLQWTRLTVHGNLEICRMNRPKLIANVCQRVRQAGAICMPDAEIHDPLASLLHYFVRLLQRVVEGFTRRVANGQLVRRGVKAECQPE